MYKIKIAIFFILVGVGTTANAQARLYGRVMDEKGGSLPYANVLLLNAADSSLSKGMITDLEGKFSLEGVASGKYLIVSSMVGFKKVYLPLIEISGQEHQNMGTISLQEDAALLDEVVIRADKPMFEQRLDRLVVNVENSITSAGGTALEVLERSPGITVNRQSGTIAMGGKQGVMVMMNGKIQRIPMSALIQLLAGMAASNIEKIELIANPSAKYDAQGDAGIINIVNKKSTGYGTNGSMSASLGYGYYMKSSGSVDLNHRTKNFNIYGSYSATYNKLWQEFILDRAIENPNQQTATISKRYGSTPIHLARIGAEWAVGKKTTFSTLVSGFDNQWKMDAYNTSHVEQSGLDSANIRFYDKELNHWTNLMGNLNINHVFKEGNSLNLDVDYLYYHDNNPHSFVNDYNFTQTSTTTQEKIEINKKTPINMGVIKLDYETLINKLKFEVGAKATYSRLNNNVLVESKKDQNEWVTDTQFTQDYAMKDDVLAAYINLSGKLNDKSQFQAGLRTEKTDMEIISGGTTKVFDLNFWSLFPSAFYSYQINKNNALQFSYGRRITRPSYQDIAPFVIFMDPFTYFSGNPKLKPTITDGVQASYSVKELLVSLKYSHDKNNIAQFQTKVDPVDKKTYWYSVNLDKVQTYSLSLSFPVAMAKWWKIQNNYMGLYQQISTLYQDVPVNITQISGQFNMTQTFTLSRNYTFELSGMYWTPSRFGIAVFKSYGNVSAGIQKKMNRGTLSINITDIFWTNIWRIETVNAALNQNQKGTFKLAEPRVIRISYSLNFGNNAVKSSRQRSTASETEQRRVK